MGLGKLTADAFTEAHLLFQLLIVQNEATSIYTFDFNTAKEELEATKNRVASVLTLLDSYM